MTQARHLQIREVFLVARCLGGVDRRAFIDTECGEDADLRAEVESLLATDSDGADALSTRALQAAAEHSATSWADAPAAHPSHIGGYQIRSVLGAGGMGVVYLAEQDRPRREVALKVIRPGLATPGLLRRFEHEAQVLALLEHPGVARIYEAGMADAGCGPQPYFAMELVRGPTLTEFAAQRKLPTRERLRLFIKVCGAVQHAHHKGVIHRDLKPGNILVAGGGAGEAAGETQPKILDFGVARLAQPDSPAMTLHTGVGQLLGTISYMSPEQACGRDVDARSDVYALGAILYELLAERPAFELSGLMIPEAVGTIRDREPSRLSSINRVFRGDLDTIVQMAMEKDPRRRYQSAAELAADLERYLGDEPIVARRAGRVYLARKFARRNKAVVVGAAAVLVTLTAGIVATTGLYLKARRESINAKEVAERATLNGTAALARLNIAYTTIQDVVGYAEALGEVPGAAAAREQLARRAVGKFVELLTSDATLRTPLLTSLGYAHQYLGSSLLALGRTSEARDQFHLSLGVRKERVVTKPDGVIEAKCLGVGRWMLAELLLVTGQTKEAASELAAARVIFEQLYAVGADVEPLGASPYLGMVHRRIGDVQLAEGNPSAARTSFTEAIRWLNKSDSTPDKVTLAMHRDRVLSLSGMGEALLVLGDHSAATGRADEAMAIIERLAAQAGQWGTSERTTKCRCLVLRARLASAAGRHDQAISLAGQAAGEAAALDAADPWNAQSRELLGRCLDAMAEMHAGAGRAAEAAQTAARAVAALEAVCKNDPLNERARAELAAAYVRVNGKSQDQSADR